MKIAVLGASGFVGTRLVERSVLLGQNEILPIVRSYASLARLSRFDLDCLVASAEDEEALTIAFKDCEAVVHSIVGDPQVITGTIAPVYRAACRAGVRRMIFLSSASVHGQAPAQGTSEASPLNAKQEVAYNNAKVNAERILHKERAKGQTEIVMLRPSIVWGPRSRWVADFADAVLSGRAYIVNGATGICNSVYVDNLLHAIELSIEKRGVDGEAFFVQDDESITWRDLYAPVLEALGHGWDSVSDVPPPAQFRPGIRDRLESLRVSQTVQSLAPHVPGKIKRIGKAILSAWPEPVPFDLWSLPKPSLLPPSQEMAILHQCAHRLRDDKIRERLGYRAIVSFEEAMRRSIGWLAFAGYPIGVRSRCTIPD